MSDIEKYINEAGKGTVGVGLGASRTKVALTSLLLLLVPLAGCAGSDGEVNVDLTTEEIQELIDDNIDDFLNNTTITVNQDVTQYNNTTNTVSQDVNYYNNTSIQQPSTLKSSSGTMTGVETVDMYPVGLALLVREDRFAAAAAGNSAAGLDSANICVGIGSLMEGDLQDWFASREIAFTSVPAADVAEATAKFIDGSCDVLAIASKQLAEEKKAQLDDDGSMGGVDIWIAALYDGGHDSPGMVGNSFSITIIQSSYEVIIPRSIFVQVDLIATCSANSTNCNNLSSTMNSPQIESVTTCSHGVSFSYSADFDDDGYLYFGDGNHWFQLFGRMPGLNCTHSLNFQISQMTENIVGYDSAVHELSWGDWVYSVVWESIPIESTN